MDSADKIAVLPAALANQIAAGEVVERPASAVKELVENALDAGATRCDVTVVGGGITLLRVKDNGSGMSPADAELSLLRHATSKLRRIEELSELLSFGFRGEALPSIASVSRFTLRTRSAQNDAGVELAVEAGGPPSRRAIAMATGTEIEVSDLFFNVPARRKFLRSSGTESGYIVEALEAAALSRPEVSFTLERDGRKAREWLRVGRRAERVAQVVGEDDLAACFGERGPLRLEAYLDRPEKARATAAAVRLFCNGRPIRDRSLLHAVAQSYGSVLERGRYPRGVIYLELPPELVDVNVHPQKSEVRFADGRAVCDAVYQLLSAELGKAFALPPAAAHRWVAREQSSDSVAPKLAVADVAAEASVVSRGESGLQLDLAAQPTASEAAALRNVPQDTAAQRAAHPDTHLLFGVSVAQRAAAHAAATASADIHAAQPLHASGLTTGATPSGSSARNAVEQAELYVSPRPNADAAEPTLSRRLTPDGAPGDWSALRYAGQLRQTFLICEDDNGYYLLDQHAAAERVNFDRIKKAYLAQSTRSQALLFPVVLQVGAEQLEIVESSSAELARLGFDIQARTETSVSVHRVPALLSNVAPERVALELLRELSRRDREFSERLDLVFATLACHGSLRAGQSVTPNEARALLTALDQVEFAGHCPHGRPVVSFTPWSELERRVGRR